MKIKKLFSAVLCLFFFAAAHAELTSQEEPDIRFANVTEAQKLITHKDNFSKNLNQFDLNLRLHHPNGTYGEWKQLVSQEVKEWEDAEKERIIKAFQTIKSNIQDMQLAIPYPKEIIFLKTSMREELDAGGYTRKNWIAIGENELKRASDIQLAQLVGHELFHVLSRHDATFKKKVYETIHFHPLHKELHWAKDIQEILISNPDIAHRDSYISLRIHGKDTKCVEIIYTDTPYTKGSIFDYLKVGFVPLNDQLKPVVEDQHTTIYPIAKVAKEFKSKIGTNTNYIIDPEEISAEHFSFLVTKKPNLPNPEIIEAIKKALKK